MTGWATRLIACSLLAVFLFAFAGSISMDMGRAFAQADAPVEDATPETAGGGNEDGGNEDGGVVGDGDAPQSLGGMIVTGGWFSVLFYIVLLLFSVWASAVALDRLFRLRRDKLLPPEFVERLRHLLQSETDTVDNFQGLSVSTDAPAARILHAGVLKAGRTLPEVEKSMEDAAAREMSRLRTRNRPLSVVGSVAPLVGLLGTVVGMIFAFQISSQQGLGKAEQLAGGIYLALMTTAAGLTIAIPCLLLVAWFNTKVERFMCEIDECLMETMPSFMRMEGRVTPPAGRRSSTSESATADSESDSSHEEVAAAS